MSASGTRNSVFSFSLQQVLLGTSLYVCCSLLFWIRLRVLGVFGCLFVMTHCGFTLYTEVSYTMGPHTWRPAKRCVGLSEGVCEYLLRVCCLCVSMCVLYVWCTCVLRAMRGDAFRLCVDGSVLV